MTPKTLRFRARGTALVQHYDRLMNGGTNSFVGRKFVQAAPDVYGFNPTGEQEEVRYCAEYVKACKDGDIWAADAETAAACGVPFDPTFGGSTTPDKPAVKSAEKGSV